MNGKKIDRPVHLGLMNIWCEFEEDWLKTLLCRVHTVKTEVGPPGGHKYN